MHTAALPRRLILGLLAGLTVGLLGCQEEDQVRRYQVPRDQDAVQDAAKYRLLAAILRQDKYNWFIKLVGPTKQVAEHADAFEQFVRSVRFTKEPRNPITWSVPAGWRAQSGSGLGRYATFRIGPREQALELRVNRFGLESGDLLDNVNRWRDLDLGLPKVAKEELAQVTRDVEAEGVKATLVDMLGPGGRGVMRGR